MVQRVMYIRIFRPGVCPYKANVRFESYHYDPVMPFDFHARASIEFINHKELDHDNLSLVDNRYEMLISETTICRTFGIRKKTIELRNWNTLFRGKFLIHASKNVDKESSEFLGIDRNMLTRGAIIGTAELYDVKQYKNKTELEIDKNKHYADIKKFGFCKYGFMIKNAQRLRSLIPYLGKLKFFEVCVCETGTRRVDQPDSDQMQR